jgi:hypothetical protein
MEFYFLQWHQELKKTDTLKLLAGSAKAAIYDSVILSKYKKR